MLALNLDPSILACGLLLAAYTSFVAFECSRGLSPAGFWLSVHGARPGVSIAVGTGLWAVQVMSDLSYRGVGTVTAHLPLVLLSWLCAVVAASALLHAAASLRGGLAKALPTLLVGGACVALTHVVADLAQGRPLASNLKFDHAATLALASLFASGAMVLALGPTSDAAMRRMSPWRIALVLVLAAALVDPLGLMTPQPANPADDNAVGGTELPAVVIALMVGLGAAVVLTVTRLSVRIEQHLKGKAAKLSDSLQAANRNLQTLAYRDPLTRLSNRLMFDRKLAAAVTAADAARGRLTLMFIDLDGFKPVNDCYGHASGDRVLRAVGERLRHTAPKGATIARIGGDEFVMLLNQPLNTGEASLLASRVLVALRTPYAVADTEVALSCSIGIAFYPDCGTADKFMACGDAAMYTAKRAGGSTFAFHEPGMGGDVRIQAELMRDLRKAVELNQFELYYQPKIDAESGQVTAVEALLRWNHPIRGLVGPDMFIPLAERVGLIGSIGDWVLEQACRQMHEWMTVGVQMRVAINLSAQQLKQHGLVGRIEQLLKHYGIAPALLTCEVTESTAMTDTKNAHRALHRLGRLGVKVSIDDFGTGYSSLSYLRQLPATELKIDRSFIGDIDTNNDARAIVQAVIQLAHALDLTVVAEGVETAAQRDMLHKLGCDEFQGYLFAKPLTSATVLQWAQAERAKPRTFRPSLFLKSLFTPLT